MKHEFRLADIGEGLEEAEIISWLVDVGDQVQRDQPLIEVMTDKSNAELPAPVSGTVIGLTGAVGDMIHVGGLIAVIDDDALTETSGVSDDLPPSTQAAPPPSPTAQISPHAQPARSSPGLSRPKASPSTRRVATERGIDLTLISGSGPGGRILLSDLDGPNNDQSTAPAPASARSPSPAVTPSTSTTPAELPLAVSQADGGPPPVAAAHRPTVPQDQPTGTIPLRGVRRAVAQNMARSWAEIPHIHAFDHIDAEPLLAMRARLKETKRTAYTSLTPLSFFVAAVAKALHDNPHANASIDMQEETITYHSSVNVGIAVAAPQGLVVPVLRGADQIDFETLSLTLGQLIRGAREGSLSREHFLDGTVTITNFGSLGGEQAVPIIRSPESMIFGFGSVAARPFVFEDEVVVRKTMHLVAGADHRLLDGDITTSVLHDVSASLTDPLRLVL